MLISPDLMRLLLLLCMLALVLLAAFYLRPRTKLYILGISCDPGTHHWPIFRNLAPTRQ